MERAPVRRARGEERRIVREMVVDGHPLHAGTASDLADLRCRRPDRAVELDRCLRDPPSRLLQPFGALLQLVLPLGSHFRLTPRYLNLTRPRPGVMIR